MKRYILIGIVLVTVSALMHAESVYDRVLMQIVNGNNELKAIAAENESYLLQLKSENNLENPEVEFEHVWGKDGVGNKWGLGISQTFDYPGLYRVRSKAAHIMEQGISNLHRNEIISRLLDAKLMLIDLTYNRRLEKSLTSIQSNVREIRDNTKLAFLRGETTILDVNKAEIELVKIGQRINACRRDIETLSQQLIALGADPSTIGQVMDYPADKLLPENEYVKMLEIDPLIGYYNDLSQAESVNVKAASMGNLPRFSVGYRHDYELGETFDGFTLGISLPFFSNRSKTASARQASAAAEFRHSASVIEAETAMRAAYRNALNMNELVSELAPVFEKTDHPALLYKALKGGEMSVLTYIQELVYFIEAETDYQSALHEFHSELARLNRYQLLLKTVAD